VNVAGDQTIVAAVAEKSIHVYMLRMVVDVANTLTFKSDATALEPPIAYSTGEKIVLDGGAFEPWYSTEAGQAIKINLLGATRVAGVVHYRVF
jgi:hypothetical protein